MPKTLSGPARRPDAHAKPLRVLLAEDNRVNPRLAVARLERRGHTVLVAPDGAHAVAIFDREPVDLILMDLRMPEMNGFEATAAIRALQRERGIHVRIVA